MAENKPRIFQGGKDITISLVVIIVFMAFAVGFTGMCSFNPGAPENGPVHEVDAPAVVSMESRAMAFPLRYPDVPEGWIPNSARRMGLNNQPAVVVGWVTPNATYVQLTQTSADLKYALEHIDRHVRTLGEPVDIDGQTFTTYTSDDPTAGEAWGTDLGDVRIIISGGGTEEDYRTMAKAILKAAPIDNIDTTDNTDNSGASESTATPASN